MAAIQQPLVGDSEYMRPRVNNGTPVPLPDSNRWTQNSEAVTQHPSVKAKSSFRVRMKGCSCRRKTKEGVSLVAELWEEIESLGAEVQR